MIRASFFILDLHICIKSFYKHSVSAGIIQNLENSLDLTQAIFGYTDKDTKEALKGRVYFSHFPALGNPKELDLRGEILGTPRASYYPNYIKQQYGKKLKSYMDAGFAYKQFLSYYKTL